MVCHGVGSDSSSRGAVHFWLAASFGSVGGLRVGRRNGCGGRALVVDDQLVLAERGPGLPQRVDQPLGLVVAEWIDHAHRPRTARVRRIGGQLGQELVDLLQLGIVRPQQQPVVFDVGIDAEALFRLVLVVVSAEVVVPVGPLLLLLPLLPGRT